MAKVNVNFTGVNEVPSGELYIEVEKAEVKQSQKGNPQLSLQCTIKDAEDPRWVGRKIFPLLALDTDMKRFTFQALAALGLDVPEGDFNFDTDELIGKGCWVGAKAVDRPDGGGLITNIKRWGIEPENAQASIN